MSSTDIDGGMMVHNLEARMKDTNVNKQQKQLLRILSSSLKNALSEMEILLHHQRLSPLMYVQ